MTTAPTDPSFAREEVAWAAGLFEGEGNVRGKSGAKKGDQFMLRVGMNDLECLKRFVDAVGGGVFAKPHAVYTTSAHYEVRLTGRDCYAAAVALYPFIRGEKRPQLQRAIEVWLTRRPKGHNKNPNPNIIYGK